MLVDEIFEGILEQIKGNGEFPEDLIDYALPEDSQTKIMTTDIHITSNLDYGASEGIYLDLYLICSEYGIVTKNKIGTIKTLRDDKKSFEKMGILLADFMVEGRKYISRYWDELDRTGFTVHSIKADGTEKTSYFLADTKSEAIQRANEILVMEDDINSVRIFDKNKQESFYLGDIGLEQRNMKLAMDANLMTWDDIINMSDDLALSKLNGREFNSVLEVKRKAADSFRKIMGSSVLDMDAIDAFVLENENNGVFYLFDKSGKYSGKIDRKEGVAESAACELTDIARARIFVPETSGCGSYYKFDWKDWNEIDDAVCIYADAYSYEKNTDGDLTLPGDALLSKGDFKRLILNDIETSGTIYYDRFFGSFGYTDERIVKAADEIAKYLYDTVEGPSFSSYLDEMDWDEELPRFIPELQPSVVLDEQQSNQSAMPVRRRSGR